MSSRWDSQYKDDYDEVIFYHRGEFFSRDNIEPGSMTLRPSGFTDGPHPKGFVASRTAARTETDEVEWPGYVNSWRGGNE